MKYGSEVQKDPTSKNYFTSADGSIRCIRCHLHPDSCTCGGSIDWLLEVFGIHEGRML